MTPPSRWVISTCQSCCFGRMKDDVPKKPLNLTQLRKNVRKRPDKTTGRKRPRIDDVEVVAAGDADENDVAALIAAVVGSPPTVAVNDECDAAVLIDSENPPVDPMQEFNRCAECGMSDPPADINPSKTIIWIECEGCSFWYHK